MFVLVCVMKVLIDCSSRPTRQIKKRQERLVNKSKIIQDALKEIDKKNGEKLIYGKLVRKDLRRYGEKIYKSTLCVESSNLSKLYDIPYTELEKITDNNFYNLFSKAIIYNEIS